MTRDESRAKCIEAMAAECVRFQSPEYAGNPAMIDSWVPRMAGAFDALHGLVTVNPPVPTEEMLLATSGFDENSKQVCRRVWRAMSAAGDLTNSPEGRYDPPLGDYGLNNPPDGKP